MLSLSDNNPVYTIDILILLNQVRKKAMIRNRSNQALHLIQDTTWESKNTQ